MSITSMIFSVSPDGQFKSISFMYGSSIVSLAQLNQAPMTLAAGSNTHGPIDVATREATVEDVLRELANLLGFELVEK